MAMETFNREAPDGGFESHPLRNNFNRLPSKTHVDTTWIEKEPTMRTIALTILTLCALVTGVQAEGDSAPAFKDMTLTWAACNGIVLSNRDQLNCIFETDGIIPALRCTRPTDTRCEIVIPLTDGKLIRIWDTKKKEWAW